MIDSWFLAHQMTWIFNTDAPWWIFTHYPERGEMFTWLYGFEVIAYILLIGFSIGTILSVLISFSIKITGQLTLSRFNHLSQSLIPLAACGVFIGLSTNTTSLLQKYANLGFWWVNDLKFILLFLATLWSLLLAYKIIRCYTHSFTRQLCGLLIMLINFAIINYSWILILHIWSLKSDSISWNTLWR